MMESPRYAVPSLKWLAAHEEMLQVSSLGHPQACIAYVALKQLGCSNRDHVLNFE